MAPEVAKRGEPYNHKADIWSLGVTLIELIDGVPPLSELNAYRVMIAIQKNDPPTVANPREMSQNFLDFLSKCLVKDYNLRWDTDALLKHSFLSNCKKSDLKALLEKTLKRREIHKRSQVPYIDHSSLVTITPESPRSPRSPSPGRNPNPNPNPNPEQVPATSASYIPLENPVPADSMVLHASTPILPEPTEPERITVMETPEEKKNDKSLPWQQPGYSSQNAADSRTVDLSPRVIDMEKPSPRGTEASPLLSSKKAAEKDDTSCCSSCIIL